MHVINPIRLTSVQVLVEAELPGAFGFAPAVRLKGEHCALQSNAKHKHEPHPGALKKLRFGVRAYG